jgi:hypothetical protein
LVTPYRLRLSLRSLHVLLADCRRRQFDITGLLRIIPRYIALLRENSIGDSFYFADSLLATFTKTYRHGPTATFTAIALSLLPTPRFTGYVSMATFYGFHALLPRFTATFPLPLPHRYQFALPRLPPLLPLTNQFTVTFTADSTYYVSLRTLYRYALRIRYRLPLTFAGYWLYCQGLLPRLTAEDSTATFYWLPRSTRITTYITFYHDRPYRPRSISYQLYCCHAYCLRFTAIIASSLSVLLKHCLVSFSIVLIADATTLLFTVIAYRYRLLPSLYG